MNENVIRERWENDEKINRKKWEYSYGGLHSHQITNYIIWNDSNNGELKISEFSLASITHSSSSPR